MIIPTIAPAIATGTTMKTKINSGIPKHACNDLSPLPKPEKFELLHLKYGGVKRDINKRINTNTHNAITENNAVFILVFTQGGNPSQTINT